VLIPTIVPLAVFFSLAAFWPFLERWATGDKSEHHVNDRPRNAPTRTAIGIAAITFYGVFWAEGANDIIADHLDVSLQATTEIARWAVVAAPVLAYIVTKRICLGLQRKDLHLLEHGVETGIIRQLPSGEYVEETRPLSEEEYAALAIGARQPAALAAGTASEPPVPPAELRGRLGRLRLRLNKVLTEGVPLNGHVHGYGTPGNGHAGNGRPAPQPRLLSSDIGSRGDEAASGLGGPPSDR
jgi:ubiquinol-cytochrome c reductase cytochrome b subunit